MTTCEVAPGAAKAALFGQLDQLPSNPSYFEQWARIDNLWDQAAGDPDVSTALIEYGANPRDSLLMRAYALDVGLRSAYRAVESGRATPQQEAAVDRLRQILPEYFDRATRPQLNCTPSETKHLDNTHFWFFQNIAEQEGIDPMLITPDAGRLGYDPTTVSTNAPVIPSMLIRKLIGGDQHTDINNLSPQLRRDVLALALDFWNDELIGALENPTQHETTSFAKLWRLTQTGGFEHDTPIDVLYQTRNPEITACVEALNRLYDVVPHLRVLFPMQNPEDLERGVREKIANALFALQKYAEEGKIAGDFSFPDGAPIPINEDSPRELIESSIQSIMIAYEAMSDPDSLPLFGRGTPDFHHCQFFNCRTGQPFPVSYHGRAERGEKFDPEYEFAGDATSRYRVQLRGDQEIPFANAEQTQDTVSFRLDFDWRGFALDFGALRHNPYTGHMNDLEVRIGRFFGFGNYLRSQQVGTPPTLNHVRELDRVCATEAEFGAFVREQERQLRIRAGELSDA